MIRPYIKGKVSKEVIDICPAGVFSSDGKVTNPEACLGCGVCMSIDSKIKVK